MTYEIYRLIYIGGAVMAGVMLAVTVILLFALKIPSVISDLTGRTAKKAISDIYNQNAMGEKRHKSARVNRGNRLTEKISPSGHLQKREDTPGGTVQTAELSQNAVQKKAVPYAETGLLENFSGNGATEVLSSVDYRGNTWHNEPIRQTPSETTILGIPMPSENIMFGDTVVLDRYAAVPLIQQGQNGPQQKEYGFAQSGKDAFEIEYEIRFVAADESLL